jgi:hypothetical protein
MGLNFMVPPWLPSDSRTTQFEKTSTNYNQFKR